MGHAHGHAPADQPDKEANGARASKFVPKDENGERKTGTLQLL